MLNGFDKATTLTWLVCLRHTTQAATRIACGVAIVVGILLSGSAYAYAPIHAQIKIKQMTPKSYAYAALNKQQYKCAIELYNKESNWRPKAKNGPHYGIPQGRSVYLKTATGINQVKWGIAYVNARYGSMCQALQHFDSKGWH